jgi:hypothetical protein
LITRYWWSIRTGTSCSVTRRNRPKRRWYNNNNNDINVLSSLNVIISCWRKPTGYRTGIPRRELSRWRIRRYAHFKHYEILWHTVWSGRHTNMTLSEWALAPHATQYNIYNGTVNRRIDAYATRANDVDAHARVQKGYYVLKWRTANRHAVAYEIAIDWYGSANLLACSRILVHKNGLNGGREIANPRATRRLAGHVSGIICRKGQSHISDCDDDDDSDEGRRSLSWSSWTLTRIIFGARVCGPKYAVQTITVKVRLRQFVQ